MDLPTADTLAFVERALAARAIRSPARLLEVGCGGGHLAEALAARGHRVIALDSSERAVVETKARGVDACLARFPAFDDSEPYDAVLFTRSLHHIPPLADAVAKAHALLRPGGAFVVDDFAWNRVDRATAAWAFGAMKVLRALDLVPSEDWDEPDDPLGAWQRKHGERHALHTDVLMLDAVRERFELSEDPERIPYFYRYLCRFLDGHDRGLAAAEAMLWTERMLIREEVIVPIGMRFCATAAPPRA
jgi:SAM-dependent methyltransferase